LRAFRYNNRMPPDEASLNYGPKSQFHHIASGLWPAAVLVLLIFLAYYPTLRCGFIWDDDAYVTENPLLTAPDGMKRIWFSMDSPSQYFPLTYTMFRLERPFWGLNPAGYHLFNILLHAANAWLVWRLLKRLGVPGAWLAAALFALHPVQVESVAWITERKNLLSLFFFLLAWRAWIEFVDERPGPVWRWYGLSLLFYVLALFAKTTACTLPAALLLVLWLKEKPIARSRLAQVAPFVALGLAMGLLTMWWERYHQGTEGSYYGLGWPERVLLASRAVWFYVGKLAWPAPLIFSYPKWTIDVGDPWAYVWPVASMGLAGLIYWARGWLGRGVEAAVLFYVAMLSPMLGFIMLATFQYSYVADHYQYVASIGLLALAAAAITVISGRLRGKWAWGPPAGCGILLLGLGVLTWRQTGIYRDRETLWRDTLKKNPASWMAHDNLGTCLFETGRLEDAMELFRRSLKLNPNGVVGHNNYSAALQRCGRLDEAEAMLRKALELAPGYIPSHINLVKIFQKRGQLNEVVEEFKTILQLLPPSGPARIGLADSLCLLGRPGEAIPYYREAQEANPTNADVRIRLGRALIENGEFGSAESTFSSVLQADPGNAKAMDGMGYALAMQGQLEAAKSRFREAMQRDPKDAYAHLHYAICLSAHRQAAEAMAEYRRALSLDPDLSLACNNLAWMLATHPDAQIRNGPEAVNLAERACRLTNQELPFYLGTLAAAYAEAGRFNDAIATAEKARDLARKGGQEQVAKRNEQLLELYRAGQPYHEPADAAQ
jgi:protein O-mannosyl-transferase